MSNKQPIITNCYQCNELAELNYRSRCKECQAGFEAAHFKVVVAGGRTFEDYALLEAKLDKLLVERNNLMIISGAANGADKLGEQYAGHREYELLRMPANWALHGNSAGYRRNVEMAERADAVVVFWDGKSRGSKHMIDIAKHNNIPTRVINY